MALDKPLGARTNNNRGMRYLVVVDQDSNHRFYLSMLLQRFEYRVVTTGTAEEALGMIAVAAPALVLVDVALPSASFRLLLQKLRQEPPTAVIGLCSNGFDPTTFHKMGVDACLHRPVPAEDLYRTVQSLIEPTPRANIRIHTKLPVTVDGKPLDCAEGECASILSEHGMYIRTLRPSAVNARVAITLTIDGRAIPISAEVRYSHRFGEGPFGEPGMGLKFAKIAAPDQYFLKEYIHANVTRGIAEQPRAGMFPPQAHLADHPA